MLLYMIEHTFASERDRHLMDAVTLASVRMDAERLARLRHIAELDKTAAYEYDGFTSVSSFLVARCGMGVGAANREVFLARSLEHMPHAVKLATSGELTVTQLELLAHAQARHPDPFEADEHTLAEASRGLTFGESRRLIDYWTQAHDEPSDLEAEPSRVFLAKTWQGRGRLDGDLDPETHDLLATALDTLISELVRTTPRDELISMPELRAEALAEIARRHLDAPSTPTDHGNRPHITAVVDYEVLKGSKRNGLSELIDGTLISPFTAQRLACDAKVCRLITGPASEILDLGRARRTVSPAQWRALRVRDRHCRFPNCQRPWHWCDAHHVEPWERGGSSDLCNLVLLCRRHHTLVHEGGWKMVKASTGLAFRRPDGTLLSARPP